MLIFSLQNRISAVRGPGVGNWAMMGPAFLSGCRNWIFWNCFAGGGIWNWSAAVRSMLAIVRILEAANDGDDWFRSAGACAGGARSVALGRCQGEKKAARRVAQRPAKEQSCPA